MLDRQIRIALANLALNQKQVAEKAKVSPSTVHNVLHGLTFKPVSRQAVEAVLEIDLDKIHPIPSDHYHYRGEPNAN